MLLKLKAKVAKMFIIRSLLLIISCLLFPYMAIAADQNFQLHGFISQGVIDVEGSNFVNDDESLSAELTELGLNGSYQLNSTLRLTGQVVYFDLQLSPYRGKANN